MNINVTQCDGQTVIAPEGMLDSVSTARFQEVIKEVLASQQTAASLDIVLDLSGLAYTSSMGVRAILSLMKAVMARQGKLVFRNVCPSVKEIFDLSGLSQAMVIE